MTAPLKATLTERLMPEGVAYRTHNCHGNATTAIIHKFLFLYAEMQVA